ncbi:hypothetical protein L1887_09744 [Cichorium endivia]|nr:hypothetical protein L1887_09744 [Cichorium endivia]
MTGAPGRGVAFSTSGWHDDEEELKWAAIERLPTYNRSKKGILKQVPDDGRNAHQEMDITNLGPQDKKLLMESILKVVEEDNKKFLNIVRARTDRVGVDIPKIEVRYKNLSIEGRVYVGSRALPTLLNATLNAMEGLLRFCMLVPSKKKVIKILHDVSGIVRPSRMTLLLGPPGSGKTTLLRALAGELDSDLRVTGEVTYCGHRMSEFIPQRTCAYISQHDVHHGEMTVRETFDFAGRCLGVGTRYDLLEELSRREKEEGIKPDPEIDAFMKATAVAGQQSSLATDYVLKILGLDICADIMVGNVMRRGISGGQKKRVTTGIVSYFWFKCPERKGVADFLQEVTSKKDQEQYWFKRKEPYRYISVPEFNQLFSRFETGERLYGDLALPYDKTQMHPAALVTEKYGLSNMELLKANLAREWLLMKRNAFLFFGQLLAYIGLNQMALSLFRFIAALGRTQVVANALGSFSLLLVFVLGGFIVAKDDIKPWMIWGYYISPIMYGQNAIVINEFLDDRWSTPNPDPRISELTVGKAILKSRGMRSQELIKVLSTPVPGSQDLYFPTKYSQSFWTQCKACLWKQHWSYWRHPQYNAVRFLMTTVIGILFGVIFWDKGQKMNQQQDVMNLMGAMYAAVMFLGGSTTSAVQSVVSIERTIFYREKAAGMYSAIPYAFAQVAIEVVYVGIQTFIYSLLIYSMVGFHWSADKFLWFYFYIFMCFVYFTLYGMMIVSLTPNYQLAAITMSFFLNFWNLFSGFMIPRMQIPIWWRWYYWGSPVAWTLYGLIGSQLGQNENLVVVLDEDSITVKEFIKDFLGFEYDFLRYVALAHVSWAALFCVIFAYGIKFLNFQRR